MTHEVSVKSLQTIAAIGFVIAANIALSQPVGSKVATQATTKPVKLNSTQSTRSELIEVASFPYDRPTGVAVSREGRLFVTLPYSNYSDDRHTYSVVEVIKDGSVKPYPNQQWNTKLEKSADRNPSQHFLNVQGNTIDAENKLWLLDRGSPRGTGIIPGGAKLVKVNLTTNRIEQTIVFNNKIALKNSFLNDVRVDAARHTAYITDTGVGGVIVVDLQTGEQRRALAAGAWMKVEQNAPVIEGVRIPETLRRSVPLGPDGIALDSKGEWIYLQAHPWLGKNVYRIKAEILRNRSLSPDRVAKHIQLVTTAVFADGIQIDQQDRLYFTDIERNAITRLNPDGKLQLLVQDERLKWPDSIAIDPNGYLYTPVAQFHLLPRANNGMNRTMLPFYVFRVKFQ